MLGKANLTGARPQDPSKCRDYEADELDEADVAIISHRLLVSGRGRLEKSASGSEPSMKKAKMRFQANELLEQSIALATLVGLPLAQSLQRPL